MPWKIGEKKWMHTRIQNMVRKNFILALHLTFPGKIAHVYQKRMPAKIYIFQYGKKLSTIGI